MRSSPLDLARSPPRASPTIARHSPREASCGKPIWSSRAGCRVRPVGTKDEVSLRCMTTGWKIVTVLPNPSGASPLQEWSLVAIPDKGEAIRAIKARHPHAAIRV